MLKDSRVEANIPASDLDRARKFYADTLGLMPRREFGDEAVVYETAGGTRLNV
jgi:catechol 2,3-dioxygenase-like lactoylglutathione lyase family enzyme